MDPSTLPSLADQSVAARGGADLYRFELARQIRPEQLAKNGDGTYTIKGLDLCKTGLFNGYVSIIDEDLEAMVARFVELRDSGIFLPPFRLDHSWSVLSVIGWFEELETYQRVDDTDGVLRTFLAGDVRITGSVDYTAEQIVDAIKRGALRPRSSELGYYVTNAGVELPLVFYGCAFVDIPAVEGLAPVELSANRAPAPRRLTNLTTAPVPVGPGTGTATPEGSDTMDPAKLARLAALRGMSSRSAEESTELDQLNDEATALGVTDEQVAAALEADPVDDPDLAQDPDPEDDPPADDPDPVDPPTDDPAPDPAADELARLRADVDRLRGEAAEREVARFRGDGVIVPANEDAATALLSHNDEAVRRAAGTILGSMTGRVALGRTRGRTSLDTSTSANPETDHAIRLGMTNDEVGAVWRALSPEERKLRQSELDAWRADRAASGVRD